MDYKYPLVADTITAEDNNAKADWLRTNPRLTMGPLVKEYEAKWSRWVGRKYSVACSSGSTANELMAMALLESNRLENLTVIVPSAAWVTSITPFIRLGFNPIMCEADKYNFGLDIHHLEQLLKEHKPSTVMLVHVLGVPAQMKEILRLRAQYGFTLLEDACAAMGSSYQGQKVGSFGDMSSISTYFGHQFSTVEGGIVSTDNKELYEILFSLRSHGWINGFEPETRAKYLNRHNVKDTGTGFVFLFKTANNFRTSDDHAFYGLRQLDRMDWLVEHRSANHLKYQKLLGNHFDFQRFPEDNKVCSIHFCALARNEDERNFIISSIEKNGIETRPFTSGNQGLQPYWYSEHRWFDAYPKFTGAMATRLYECGFFLPNYPLLKPMDIEIISATAIGAAVEFRKEE
jgi:CDP-6-deoxy-D-xylo-4-hexulose-3-dehydrase